MPDMDYWLGIKYGLMQQAQNTAAQEGAARAAQLQAQTATIQPQSDADIALRRAQAEGQAITNQFMPQDFASQFALRKAQGAADYGSANASNASAAGMNILNRFSASADGQTLSTLSAMKAAGLTPPQPVLQRLMNGLTAPSVAAPTTGAGAPARRRAPVVGAPAITTPTLDSTKSGMMAPGFRFSQPMAGTGFKMFSFDDPTKGVR